MYTLQQYAGMVNDRRRFEAYASALRRVIHPGSVVLELGTGMGTFAVLACHLGARRVFAIEPNDAIHVGKELAAANGFANRIEFIQDVSSRVTLRERADILLSDLRGVLPFHRSHLPAIIDARARLLAPGAELIARRDTLWIAGLSAADLHTSVVCPADTGIGLNFDVTTRYLSNCLHKTHAAAENVLLPAHEIAQIDYRSISQANVCADTAWTATGTDDLHGFALWFDSEFVPGISLSNRPGGEEHVYGQVFLPLPRAVTLAPGDVVSLAISANLVPAGHYVWRWRTVISTEAEPDRPKAQFDQSTFYGQPMAPDRVRAQAEAFMPVLKKQGEICHFILGLMNGNETQTAIAEKTVERFPTRFDSRQQALERVRELAQRYSR